MRTTVKHLIFTLALFLFCGRAGAGITETTLAKFLDLSDFNEVQKGIILQEVNAHTAPWDSLAKTDVEAWKDKMEALFHRIRNGFTVYKLARDPEITRRIHAFETETGANVYLLTYVDDSFLNNIFYRLSEAFYTAIKPNSYIQFKFKFGKTPKYTEENPSYVLRSDTILIAEAIKPKLQMYLAEASNIIYNNLHGVVSDAVDHAPMRTTLVQLMDLLEGAGLKGNENIKPVSFVDPAGNAFSIRVGSDDFKILSAIKHGPLLSFYYTNKIYEARFTENTFKGYFGKDNEVFKQENGYATPLYFVSGFDDNGSGKVSVDICNIPVEYDEVERKYKCKNTSKVYAHIPEEYSNQAIRSSCLLEDIYKCTTDDRFKSVIFFQGDKVKADYAYPFSGRTTTLFSGTFDGNYIAQLEKKYSKVKTTPGVISSFVEREYLVSYDKNQKKWKAKPVSEQELKEIKDRIENGDIDEDSEVLYEIQIRNGVTTISLGALGYNNSVVPQNSKFTWDDQTRKTTQTVQKNKINDKLYENRVIDITTNRGGGRSIYAFPDNVETKIKDLSWIETISQITKESSEFIRDCKIPERMYNPQAKGFTQCIINTSPYFSGVINAVVDEVNSVPQLILLATDIVLDESIRDNLVRSFKELTLDKIQNEILNSVIEVRGNIINNSVHGNYAKGTYTVAIAAIVLTGGVKKIHEVLDKVDDGLAKNVDEIGETMKEKLGNTSNFRIKYFGDIPFINGKDPVELKAIPKGKRPDPYTYLDRTYIIKHIQKFEDEGASFIFTSDDISDPLFQAFNPKKYVMLKSDMDNLIKEFKRSGDISVIEIGLGYEPGSLVGKDLYVKFIDNPKVKMPDGNEGGANKFWNPGGVNSGGKIEAVLDNEIYYRKDSTNPIYHNNDISVIKNVIKLR